MLNDPNTRQLLGATVVTPDWNALDTNNKTRWTFNIHTDSQNTTNSITQVNNNNVILGQTFDQFGNTLKSNLNLGSLNNPLIKTKDDLLNIGVPVPGWQGSTQTNPNTFDFGRRQYNSNTAQFNSQDPVTNGVSYNPFGNSGVVEASHGDLDRISGQYSINGQNPLSQREWDGYDTGNVLNSQLASISIGNNATVADAYREGLDLTGYIKSRLVDKTILTLYIPSWRDYVGSSEKLFNDEFEGQLLLASFCNTDTLFPYNCNEYHSDLGRNYNTSVSPNVRGLADYQVANTRWIQQTIQVEELFFDEMGYMNSAGEYTDAVNSQITVNVARNDAIKNYWASLVSQPNYVPEPIYGEAYYNNATDQKCYQERGFSSPVCYDRTTDLVGGLLFVYPRLLFERAKVQVKLASACTPNSPYADFGYEMGLTYGDCGMIIGSVGVGMTAAKPTPSIALKRVTSEVGEASINADRIVITTNNAALPKVTQSRPRNVSYAASGVRDASVSTSIDDAVNYSINQGKQDKHIVGTNNYQPGRSILTYSDPQELVTNYAGTGVQKGNLSIKLGESGSSEVVDFGKEIGIYKNIDGTIIQPTSKGQIIYAKDGVHIVPARP